MPDSTGVRELYHDLRQLHFDLKAKASKHENLLDVLEVCAVFTGLKPAHLNGQGMRSEQLLADLESLAGKYGMRTLRTRQVFPFKHRTPKMMPEFVEWQDQKKRREIVDAPDVLWVFRDAVIGGGIADIVDGRSDESAVLGYPACCVRHHLELGVQMGEMLEEGYRTQHGGKTLDDFIRLSLKDVVVRATRKWNDTSDGTKMLYRFVQFSACPDCLRDRTSPAGRVNAQMRDLAMELDRSFAGVIDAAGLEDFRSYRTELGAPCPCSSGRLYRACHGKGLRRRR